MRVPWIHKEKGFRIHQKIEDKSLNFIDWIIFFFFLKTLRDLGSVSISLILLKIENWKHCNKIIFKFLNSAVWPIFNKSFVEKRDLWVPWTVYGNGTHWNSINALQKKKKNARHGTQMCDSNGYLVNFIKTRFVQVFFFFFF